MRAVSGKAEAPVASHSRDQRNLSHRMNIEILKQAVLDSRDGITISDNALDDNPLIFVNPAFERMTGYSFDEITNRNCRYLQREDREQLGCKVAHDALRDGQYCLVTLRNYRRDGSMFWNELSISPIYNAEGEVTNFIGIQKDVTARTLIQAQLRAENQSLTEARSSWEQLSIRDGLTGIFNRRFFDTQFEIQCGIAIRNSAHVAVLMVDVDQFKEFNDIYGHQAGDEALKRVADCLNESFLRASDFVARYGGEEFVILSVGTTQDQASKFAALLCQRVRNLHLPHTGSRRGHLTISIGVSVRDFVPGDQSLTLLKRADSALYDAKRRGRDQYSVT
jgi:diguanylate cyclase (GGDEF)-like protein/PAS domain S-box-containing protein